MPLQLRKTTTSPCLATASLQCLRSLWLLTAEVSLILTRTLLRCLTQDVFKPVYTRVWDSPLLSYCNSLSLSTMYDVLPVHAGKIIGGQRAVPHSRPYMAIVQKHALGNNTTYCDGFLLNEYFVMTAAHCRARLVCQSFVVPMVLLFHHYCTWFQFLRGLSGSWQCLWKQRSPANSLGTLLYT